MVSIFKLKSQLAAEPVIAFDYCFDARRISNLAFVSLSSEAMPSACYFSVLKIRVAWYWPAVKTEKYF